MSPNQQNIVNALKRQEQLSLDDAIELIGGNIYANKRRHVGATMSRMVRRGLVVRVRPGVFELPSAKNVSVVGDDLFAC